MYVYKSLRRPHIPEARKERATEERKIGKRRNRRVGTEVKMCEEWSEWQAAVSALSYSEKMNTLMTIFGKFKDLFCWVCGYEDKT